VYSTHIISKNVAAVYFRW